ncbi:hypothetical protein BDK51DRAFT_27295 [Blyttiomyces helicus]|uniref:Transmembrane protein n=1 Tax=Blyttiomyces helicus TaxID=388810 RepID=A0A4P9W7F0_9FUNG|nr:hypothetical protein BDK51DRAFT_27295 [Blyttiomyces helicus]|eukprot:RKO88284.1 hypothetical protein BDK51DRAFT_27295 [Blyttiomyces helicus]
MSCRCSRNRGLGLFLVVLVLLQFAALTVATPLPQGPPTGAGTTTIRPSASTSLPSPTPASTNSAAPTPAPPSTDSSLNSNPPVLYASLGVCAVLAALFIWMWARRDRNLHPTTYSTPPVSTTDAGVSRRDTTQTLPRYQSWHSAPPYDPRGRQPLRSEEDEPALPPVMEADDRNTSLRSSVSFESGNRPLLLAGHSLPRTLDEEEDDGTDSINHPPSYRESVIANERHFGTGSRSLAEAEAHSGAEPHVGEDGAETAPS